MDNATERINIIKKGTNLYYQTDLGKITFLGDLSGFDQSLSFDVPVTFGCNINASGAYDCKFKGTLSNM